MALLLFPALATAQPLRVTSWNLQPPAGTNVLHLPAAAAALKKLDPDVILLQQVTDRAMCDDLADALKPAQYQVVICSAFRETRTGALRSQQVAILARAKATSYFSSAQPWQNRDAPALPGGMVFAAVEFRNQRLGLFSLQADTPAGTAAGKKPRSASVEQRQTATIEQFLAKVGSITNWATNQVQVFVAGGSFALSAQALALTETSLQRLQAAGFGDAFRDVAAAERATLWARPGTAGPTTDYLFTQPANCAVNPAVFHVAAARHYPISCEVEPPPPPSMAPPASRVEPAPAPSLPEPLPEPAAAAAAAPPAALNPQLVQIAIALGAIAALVLGVWFLARRGKPNRAPNSPLLTEGAEGPSGYTVVLTAPAATESASTSRRAAPASRPLIHLDTTGDTQTHAEFLQQRALAAEQRAERADALLRAGLLPQLNQWLKQTLARKLIADRAQLLETQQAAALKALAVEQRLSRIEQQLRQQNQAYEKRIAELTQLLAVAKEENRELIRARIAQVKAEMAAARARLMTQAESDTSA